MPMLSVWSNKAAAAERVMWTGRADPSSGHPELIFTLLNPIILRRVAANLLANATRAAGTAGRVTIEVRRRDGRILLVVEDNGPGFGCLPRRRGLGLSAAPGRRGCQGRLECGRGDLGGGRVSLWLPLAEADSEGSRMRLVLCDDNRLLCEALASVLQARGHPIIAITTCVAEGIAAIAEHRPDACLLDLCLPDGSGLDAARAMRRHHPDTKILVLSCLADPAVLAEAKKIGVAGFLRKDLKAETITGCSRRDRRGRSGLRPEIL